MQAALVTRYGPPDVVVIRQVPTPKAKAGQVIVRQHATSVTSGDSRIRAARMPRGFGLVLRLVFGFTGPRQPILGNCIAGEVAEVGPGVSSPRVGDRIMATTGFAMRAHAEYVAIKASRAIALPQGLSMAEAAALPFGALTALFYLRDRAKLKAGEKVLVIGASGAVGAAMVQLAQHMGAEVTGICSAANQGLVLGLGAAQVIDYHERDFRTLGQRYDVIVDCVGEATAQTCAGALVPGGRLCLVIASLGSQLTASRQSRRFGIQIIAGVGKENPEDLRYLADLAAHGSLRPHIGASLPFERIVEAHGLADTGRKRANTVITFARRDG